MFCDLTMIFNNRKSTKNKLSNILFLTILTVIMLGANLNSDIDPEFDQYNQYEFDKNPQLIFENKLPNTALANLSILELSSFFGGSSADTSYGINTDTSGALYIVGTTSSSDLTVLNAYSHIRNGSSDAFIAKFNANGTLNFSTYFGGSGTETAKGIAIDNDGAYYVVGLTTSADFPTKNAIDSSYNSNTDVFITKFNSDNSLNYSTYLGGNGTDDGKGIMLDSIGSCYVIGDTQSANFTLQNAFDESMVGYSDAFVTKLNHDGSLNFSTYIGGSSTDYGNDLVINASGTCYFSGTTTSTDFPTTIGAINETSNGGTENFFAIIGNNGTLEYSSYFGGINEDIAAHIALDQSGALFLAGTTLSTNYPIKNANDSTHNGYWDMVVTKINPDFTLNFSTFIGATGGMDSESISDIVVDNSGVSYVLGTTDSSTFPTYNAYFSQSRGSTDIVLITFDEFGVLTYSTYFGGSAVDIANQIAIDNKGHCFFTGYTQSSNYPLYNAVDSIYGSNEGIFTSFLFDDMH